MSFLRPCGLDNNTITTAGLLGVSLYFLEQSVLRRAKFESLVGTSILKLFRASNGRLSGNSWLCDTRKPLGPTVPTGPTTIAETILQLGLWTVFLPIDCLIFNVSLCATVWGATKGFVRYILEWTGTQNVLDFISAHHSYFLRDIFAEKMKKIMIDPLSVVLKPDKERICTPASVLWNEEVRQQYPDRSCDDLLGRDEADIIVLGSGSSAGVPGFWCCLPITARHDPPPNKDDIPYFPRAATDIRLNENGRTMECPVCGPACRNMTTGQGQSNNYRNNPSILIRIPGRKKEGKYRKRRHIQIDCGKTFRDAVIRWYPYYGVPTLDALILTHEHADAILGLDDIRGIQKATLNVKENMMNVSESLDVYTSKNCGEHVRRVFPYIFPEQKSKSVIQRHTASVRLHLWDTDSENDMWKPQVLCDGDFEITPFPVMHGCDFSYMLGFVFGNVEESVVVYLSDVTEVKDPRSRKLLEGLDIEVLFLDSLFKNCGHGSHIGLQQGLEIVQWLMPKRTLLTGLSHDFDTKSFNEEFKKLNVQVGEDGMRIPIKWKVDSIEDDACIPA